MLRLTSLLVATIGLSACSITAHLYPTKGPLSSIAPLPVIDAQIHGVLGGSGNIELTMPDGEACKGHWSVTAPQMAGSISTFGTGAFTSGIEQAFVSIHGSSFYSGSLPGVNNGQAMVTGPKGTVIDVAFKVGSGTASGFGVAIDNHGNTYKVLF